MSKVDYYIGIDPDVDKSGFAVWDTENKCFDDLCCEDLPDLFNSLLALHQEFIIKVRLEAGWLEKGLNWHKGGNGSANAVGRNHEIGRQIEKFCCKHGIQYELVKPLGYSSYTHQRFCMLTSWPSNVPTNSEKRVAGLLSFGF